MKPALSWLQLSNSHVRNWHIADVPLGLTNVDFWGQKRTVTNRCLPISIYEYTAWSRFHEQIDRCGLRQTLAACLG